MQANDAQLIEKSIEEPEVFGAIFDRYFTTIYRFCVRRVGAVAGEDLAGDVFRWAFENRHRFDPTTGDCRPWLYRIANNFVRNAVRSSGRQAVAYDRWVVGEGQDSSPLDALVAGGIDADRDLRAVAAALELQPPEEVETLLLFAWDGLAYAEIASVLDIPIGTVRSRISRIRRRLRDVLDTSLLPNSCQDTSLGGNS